jgi:SAM-dependent methyltransferase
MRQVPKRTERGRIMGTVPDRSYDAIPYRTYPRLETHPDRLAAVGTLLGMKPAPVERCRVLEVGCGDGGNLIPMAYALPHSRFAGVDLARTALRRAEATAKALRLENVRLAAADLRQVDAEWGAFDYIVAHGVYSWTPEPVRDGLMKLCGERLAPNGIAFISYNALPGSRFRQMLREMLREHVRNARTARRRLTGAREFLAFLLEARMLPEPWQALFDVEVQRTLDKSDGALFHDDLAEVNHAVSITEFARHAGTHGLAYLGEAEPHQMFDHRSALAGFRGGAVEREQYLDFLKLRRFRQTLLCRKDVKLRRKPGPERMDGFGFSSQCPAGEPGEGEQRGLGFVRISAPEPAVRNVAGALTDMYPLPLSFAELVPYAGSEGAAREILFTLVAGGFANLHVHDFPCAAEAGPRPRASLLARLQAKRSGQVTSLCHQTVELDGTGRELLLHLDGTRTPNELAAALSGAAGISAAQARRLVPRTLEWLAQVALLES